MKSLQGHLLIASDTLLDANFYRTVVLIVQHNEHGALGLILNRPLDMTLEDVWEQISEMPCLNDAPLHQGGPCEGTLMILHGDDSLSPLEVLPGVYFSTEKEDVEHLVSGYGDNSPAKFFVGYSGWSADQLEGELESGAWLTLPATARHIFETAGDLWTILCRRINLTATYPWLSIHLIPDDPSVN